ncbi:MAG: NAD(P)-dependent oxidoreductase [Pseudomonadota bacterium]
MMPADLSVGVIGLGAMGRPMADTLMGAGFDVTGFDMEPSRAIGLAHVADSVEDIGRTCDVTLLSLPNSAIVEQVCAKLFAVAPQGHLILDTSTAEPASTRALQAEAAKHGIGFVDGPVSGGAKGAGSGTLLVMAGGIERDVERAMPVLDAMARKVVCCGGSGAGNVAKLINNLLCAAHLSLAGEALQLADKAGLAIDALLDALNAGSGRSAVTEVNLPTWVLSDAYDSGFTMGLMRKDVRLAAALADDLGAEVPMAALAAARWADSVDDLTEGADFNRMVDLSRAVADRDKDAAS